MRGKPPKEIEERRNQKPGKKPEAAPSRWTWDWKYSLATALAIAGLILGAISLQARPTVSLEAPLDPADVLTTPFVISNDGMLSLNSVNVESYFSRIGYGDPPNGADRYSIGRGFSPRNQTLEIGEKETVRVGHFMYTNTPPVTYADIAWIVYFRSPFIPILRHRVFRFVTVRQKDGTLRLQEQAAGNILNEYELALKESKIPLPPY
jgi:hypothetical protein